MLSSLQRIRSREKRSSSPSSLAPSSPVGIASNSIGSVVNVNMEQLDVAHPTIRVPHDTWFFRLQDVGTEMSATDFAKFADNDRKMKAYNIAFGGYFYRELYQLAETVYDLIDAQRESDFIRLPKKSQCTTVIHTIGKIIAGQRRKTPRAEISDEILIERDEYLSTNSFFIMSQDNLFDILRSRYGVSPTSMMKITVDDKVRVAGLLMTKAPLREYLSDLMGKSRGGD